MNTNKQTVAVRSLTAVVLAGLAVTTANVQSEELLAVDFGTAGVEPGFVGQTTYSATHTTPAGDVTVAISDNPQGFYVYAGGGTNPALFDDFIFDNSGPMTLTLSGPGISANTEYDLTFWSYYGVQARNTTFTAVSGTTGDTVGPIAWDHPTTSLSDNSASGTFTSDGSGNLTFSLGAGRPAINALTIATIGGGATDPKITSITSVGSGVWQLTLEGESETAYEFRSSATLDFDPGTLVEPLTDGVPAVGTIGGDNNSQLTTDVDGNGTVRMTLAGPANYVVAQVPPPPPPLLDEDFESDNGGFTALTPTAGTDWEHGAPISNDLGGVANPGGSVTGGNGGSTKCWGTDIGNPGRYADPTTDSCLRSPNFDLTGASAAELTFAEALDLAAGDSAVVQLINAAGDVWIADVYAAADGDISTADWADANSGNPIDLSAGIGNTVYLQWCFSGNGGDDDDYMGWYIDDVVVTDTSP